MKIRNRIIDENHKPFVIPDIGINHDGDFDRAILMMRIAASVGAECVKFQCHIPDAEMVAEEAKKIIPVNAEESIYHIMRRCSFTEDQEKKLKKFADDLGLIYINTPFCKEAVDRLEKIGVECYKIGSGECNNYPLVEYIAKTGKPIILSTGMNNIDSMKNTVDIFREYHNDFAIMHCTSLYPTPHEKVRLGAMWCIRKVFGCMVGLSDHSMDNYACFGAVAMGASLLERHFTLSKFWSGPDMPFSMDQQDLKDLIAGSEAIFKARSGVVKEKLVEEEVTAKFAYASVVSIKDIQEGEVLDYSNIWVKRPGTGDILAEKYYDIIGKKSKKNIKKDTFLKLFDVE